MQLGRLKLPSNGMPLRLGGWSRALVLSFQVG